MLLSFTSMRGQVLVGIGIQGAFSNATLEDKEQPHNVPVHATEAFDMAIPSKRSYIQRVRFSWLSSCAMS